MKPNWEFLWKDLLVFAYLGLAICYWNKDGLLPAIWAGLFIYSLVKQLYDHYTYYKATKKYY
jgi:hypothetical protein